MKDTILFIGQDTHKELSTVAISGDGRDHIVYDGKANWTLKYLRWLTELIMPHPSQQIVLQEYIRSLNKRITRLELITPTNVITITQLVDIQIRKTWRTRPTINRGACVEHDF